MSRALHIARPCGWAGTAGLALLIVIPTIALLCTPYPYLSVIPGLAAVGACVALRYPHLVFAAILVMIPFGSFRGPLQKILALALLLIVAIQSIRDRALPAEWKSRLWPWLVAFLAVNVLSALLSEYTAWSVENLSLLCMAMLFFALGLVYMGQPSLFRWLPALIGGSVSFGSFLAILGFLFGLRPFLEPVEHFKRATGGTLTAPSLAALIIFATPFVAYTMRHARRPSTKLLWCGLFTVNAAAIVTTYSRGGAIVFALLLGVMSLAGLRRLSPRQAGLLVAGVLVLAALAVTLIPPSYWERQKSLIDPDDRSIGRRTSYLMVASEAVQERPILGHGPGAFRKAFGGSTWSLHFKGARQESLERYAHNTYIEVLVGSGFVGLAVFLLFLAHAVRDFARARAQALKAGEQTLADMAAAGQLALLALLLYFVIYSSVYDKSLWVGLALSQVVLRKAEDLKAVS